MKKSISLLCSGLLLTIMSQSQTNMSDKRGTISYKETVASDNDALNGKSNYLNQGVAKDNDGDVLETTTYDLQTNSSVQDRIIMDENGNMTAVWTASQSNASAFSDRGTGYSYYNATSNTWTVSEDYPRIESERTGWPSVMYTSSGGEVIISHATTNNRLLLNSRGTKGTGAWSEKDVSTTNLTWNRAVMGGSNGNTIHVIAATDTLDAAQFQNMDRAVVYYRSQDGGQTFDIQDSIIPGMDSSMYSGTGGDNYAIAARGNVVVIASFNQFDDVFIMKSTNNGDTWTRTQIFDFPYAGFDDFDNNHDTTIIPACDAAGTVIIDDNDVAHVVYGRTQVANNDMLGDGTFTFQFITDSLVYWNEGMGAENTMLIGSLDLNNDGVINVSNVSNYRSRNIMSYPHLALGDNGDIYVSFAGQHEEFTDLGDPETNFKHIFVMRSTDGGNSWGDLIDFTPFDDFAECVYASMVRTVDNRIRMIYQRDLLPSIYLITPPASPSPRSTYQNPTITDNEIVFLSVDTGFHVGVENVLNEIGETSLFPNPATNEVTLSYQVMTSGMYGITMSNVNGQTVEVKQPTTLQAGRYQDTFSVENLESGLYVVSITWEGGYFSQKLLVE